MDPLNDSSTAASSLPARKITRQDLAAHFALSLRTVDELTRQGLLPYFKIGKSIRYDREEVKAALRERGHAKSRKGSGKSQPFSTAE